MSDSEVSSECSYAYSCYSDDGEESYEKGCNVENSEHIARGEATGSKLLGDRSDRALVGEECTERSGASLHKRAKYTMEEDYDNDLTRDCTQLTASEQKAERIVQWLRKFPVSPMNYIFSTNIWLTSEWKFLNQKGALMDTIIKIQASFYNNLSIEELYTHFMSVEPNNLIFHSPKGNIDNYYYGIEESIDVCEKLIAYQFFNNEHKIKYFYDCLFAVINKTRPKKNSILILSPPNAGKNFFFDAVIHYFVNYGQLGNFNRYCSFPLTECVNKRIILWDQPYMEPAASKTLKCILGGDNCNAKDKFKNDAVIMRTPVIILSNSDIFPEDESFRTRMYQFNWRPAQFLINYKLKPHPLCFYHLFNKYSKM